jgi:hypothetical protein
MRYLILLLLLAGCADSMKMLTLYPPAGWPGGQGTMDLNARVVAVTIGQETFRGRLSDEGRAGTSAVLSGATGQLRCTFGPISREGIGLCVDEQGKHYDVMVK